MMNPCTSSIQSDENPSAEDDVKERCWDQREALPGEPICVVCGRYGEYICDETDDDVCSLECKRSLLARAAENSLVSPTKPPSIRIPTKDECYYIHGSHQKLETGYRSSQSEAIRRKLEIVVRGNNVPEPLLSFCSGDLPEKLLQNLEAAYYEIPTPVQMQAIPLALSGRSLLVSAETGSGKTCSFLVPIISHCAKLNNFPQRPAAMVLAPTRELCIQVEEQAKLLGKGLPFKTALIVGGDAMAGQVYRIQQGVSMIVGTPGRLIDLLSRHDFPLDSVSMFVVDEVDCMIQRGFLEQVTQIFRALYQPQVLMYSATVSKQVETVALSMVKELAIVSVGNPSKPNKAVKQVAIWVESNKKKEKLFSIIKSKQHFKPPVVVFVESKLGADLLSSAITAATGVKALSIHGDKPMKERREILGSFLVGDVMVIVSTGVLGRGVDLLHVRQVIVFDMPNSIKEYVHQIGRASRMGEDGIAIAFINEENKKLFPDFVQVLKSCGAAVPPELANSRYTNPAFASAKYHSKKRKR